MDNIPSWILLWMLYHSIRAGAHFLCRFRWEGTVGISERGVGPVEQGLLYSFAGNGYVRQQSTRRTEMGWRSIIPWIFDFICQYLAYGTQCVRVAGTVLFEYSYPS